MTLAGLLQRFRGRASQTDGTPALWLGDPGADDPSRVGGKAAHLSRLAGRWPVPPGFCLPTDLHREGVSDLRSVVRPAYRRLGAEVGRLRPAVAVRSSAVGEDSTESSFAGQHETVLNVVGARGVADAVVRCWASARSAHVQTYRAAHGIDEDEPAMAVLVQHLVDAEVSAIVFSADPVTGDRDQVVINASWGLGEAVVDGRVIPDSYRLSHEPLEVVARQVADKDRMVVRRWRGTREVAVPEGQRTRHALDAERCRELARLALDLEAEMGWPVDLECAYADDRLHLLQCRPITSLPTS